MWTLAPEESFARTRPRDTENLGTNSEFGDRRDVLLEFINLPKCKKTSRLSPVFPTHHRPHSASSRCVPLPSNLLLPELFHHHQRVKIPALNPEGTRHHAVRLEAKLPVKLPATWIVDCDI
jgi:hypothetical protein